MNSNTILQSNILDILFENRNKDYGAYRLRKYYNNRLGMALMVMMCVVILFAFFQFFRGNTDRLTKKNLVFQSNDYKPSVFEPQSQSVLSGKQNEPKIRKKSDIDAPPKIVVDKNINNSIASANQSTTSDIITTGEETATGFGGETPGAGKKLIDGYGSIPVVEKKRETPEILPVAEIMPQYPGGLKALLAYLKKNLHAPQEIDDGKMISVKVKFVVNLNGQLESFKVIESGGEVFDNEVLRVLRKMPNWIPGKSNGENVSVYYTVPVKFTGEFE